jgi:NADH dehydrogenase
LRPVFLSVETYKVATIDIRLDVLHQLLTSSNSFYNYRLNNTLHASIIMHQTLVIIGSGFAGMWSALAARRMISSTTSNGGSDIEVVVISPEARLVVRPRLYETNPENMSVSLEELFQVTEIRHVQGRVESIHADKHEIMFLDSAHIEQRQVYDRLILAAGSRLQRPNLPGLQAHAFDCDQIEGAIKLDTHLKSLASMTPSGSRNTFVVCGGGFTGIELAAELPQRVRSILGADVNVRIIIVERESAIGPDLGPNPRPVIIEALRNLGVETRLGVSVASIDAKSVTFSTGERIEALTVVWTAGVVANDLNQHIPGKKDQLGRLHVDSYLRTLSVKDIYATGDAAYAATDDEGNHTLMSCQHAMPLGTAAGHNAAADLLGLPMLPYSQPYYGTCLDLGAFGAVVGEGWEREVIFKGKGAKPIKQFINDTLIYPPKATIEEAFGGADPAVSAAPAARKLYLAMMEDARMRRLVVD